MDSICLNCGTNYSNIEVICPACGSYKTEQDMISQNFTEEIYKALLTYKTATGYTLSEMLNCPKEELFDIAYHITCAIDKDN